MEEFGEQRSLLESPMKFIFPIDAGHACAVCACMHGNRYILFRISRPRNLMRVGERSHIDTMIYCTFTKGRSQSALLCLVNLRATAVPGRIRTISHQVAVVV